MTTQFQKKYPEGTINDFSAPFSDKSFTATLAANTAQSVTVPQDGGVGLQSTLKGNYIALFKVGAGSTVLVAKNKTAVVAPASFANTECEVIENGMGRAVQGGDVLSFITADTTAVVNVVFWYFNL